MAETGGGKGINTADSSRDSLGVTGIINPSHKRGLFRTLEDLVSNKLDSAKQKQETRKPVKRVWIDDNGVKHTSIDGVEQG